MGKSLLVRPCLCTVAVVISRLRIVAFIEYTAMIRLRTGHWDRAAFAKAQAKCNERTACRPDSDVRHLAHV